MDNYQEILVSKNFLSHDVCDKLISAYENLEQLEGTDHLFNMHRDTKVMYLPTLCEERIFRYVMSKATGFAQRAFGIKGLYPNISEMVQWNGDGQPYHLDDLWHYCTTIVYLNDNYSGGETVIGKDIIKPEKGKLIAFKGNVIPHGVSQVSISDQKRYTFASWYVNPQLHNLEYFEQQVCGAGNLNG